MALSIHVKVTCDFCGQETEATMQFVSPHQWEVDAPENWSVETVDGDDDERLETYCSTQCRQHNHGVAQA